MKPATQRRILSERQLPREPKQNESKAVRSSVNYDNAGESESQDSSIVILEGEEAPHNEMIDYINHEDLEVLQLPAKRVKSYRLSIDGSNKRFTLNQASYNNMLKLKALFNDSSKFPKNMEDLKFDLSNEATDNAT